MRNTAITHRVMGGLCALVALATVWTADARVGRAAGTGVVSILAASGAPLGSAPAMYDLPAALSDADARLYRKIFALQEAGRMRDADGLIAQIGDPRLMGHVLAQRYLHPTAYRSRFRELRDWMARYADHPEADRIYKLALKRKGKGAAPPRAPQRRKAQLAGAYITQIAPYQSTKRLNRTERRSAARLKRQIRRNIARTRLSVTEDLLQSPKSQALLDTVEIDEGYAGVAAAWYYFGKNDKAFALADGAARRSGAAIPIAHWTAGLAAWRLGRVEEAAWHFERLASATNASPWNSTAGAYWAARAHLRLRQPEQMSTWLAIAAAHPRTFYGMLANRALGLRPQFAFQANGLTADHAARLMSEPATARALALVQVGQRVRAEQELSAASRWSDLSLTTALLALAEQQGMAELAHRVGNRLAAIEFPEAARGALDAARYPIPQWQPQNGFVIDRALVYALIRQESGFNPEAKSPDGARGLMQLMPSTASFIARDRGFRRSKRGQLYDPATNLDLGQRYITHLMGHSHIQGNLFRLVTAYNGGPGNLNKWQRGMDYGDDPLLFIESLPSRETRIFIERVLTNLWIYRLRLDQPTPSLDGIATGAWPQYVALDAQRPPELARNERAGRRRAQ